MITLAKEDGVFLLAGEAKAHTKYHGNLIFLPHQAIWYVLS
jgi:hypothetical protein